MTGARVSLLSLVLALLASRCGSRAPGLGDAFFADAADPDPASVDPAVGEAVLDGGGEAATDVRPDRPPEVEGPGSPGWPCEDDADCLRGPCLETPDGRRCVRPCTAAGACDAGFECEDVGASPEVLLACVHVAPRECWPCRVDGDCGSRFSPSRMACIRMDDRSWCVRACISDWDCGVGGECAGDGNCTPEGGACACRVPGEAAPAPVGACFRAGEGGECEGSWACGPDGPGPCDAPAPVAETCNGQDDDCDGATDEGCGA